MCRLIMLSHGEMPNRSAVKRYGFDLECESPSLLCEPRDLRLGVIQVTGEAVPRILCFLQLQAGIISLAFGFVSAVLPH